MVTEVPVVTVTKEVRGSFRAFGAQRPYTGDLHLYRDQGQLPEPTTDSLVEGISTLESASKRRRLGS